MDNQQLAYLQAMGIDVWQQQTTAAIEASKAEPTAELAADATVSVPTHNEYESTDVAQLNWQQLLQKVQQCQACALHQTRTQTVFGVGDQQADLLIVGEAPGANEDRQGEPFVGRAGQLLNAMLVAIGLSRQKIYIANILKCRPPRNRDPKPEETQQCTPFLERQVALLQPKLIMAVGRIAAHYLLQTNTPMGRLRGRRYQFRQTGIPLIVSYHPAYLLRAPNEKRKAYQDLLLAQQLIAEVGGVVAQA